MKEPFILNLKMKGKHGRVASQTQIDALEYLNEHGYTSGKELSQYLNVSYNWAATSLARLYKKNHIKRFSYILNNSEKYAYYLPKNKEHELKLIQILKQEFGNRDKLRTNKEKQRRKDFEERILNCVDEGIHLCSDICRGMTARNRTTCTEIINRLCREGILTQTKEKNTFSLHRANKGSFQSIVDKKRKILEPIGMYDYLYYRAEVENDRKKYMVNRRRD